MRQQGRPRHRFAITPDSIVAGQVRFSAAAARQMRRVLRLKRGDQVAAFDGQGAEYTVMLVSLRDECAVGSIQVQAKRAVEPRLKIRLCQSLLPREKFEVVLQKATEIGVSAFVPLVTERSLVPASSIDAARMQRWRRIVAEAAEQAGRGIVPELSEPVSLLKMLGAGLESPAVMAWELEKTTSLRQVLDELIDELAEGRLTLIVGPEGGFSEAEAQAARAAGAATASIGPRILRTETAGPVIAALALFHAGEMEPIRR